MYIKSIRSAIAIARMNAYNDNYQCGVTIAEVEEMLSEIRTLRNAAVQSMIRRADKLPLMAERDEWRRRAKRLLVLATKHCNKYHHDWREITEAAQWFED